MVKCAGLGCYPLRLKWITLLVVCRILHILHILSYSLYPKAKFDNCFIIHSQYFPVLKEVLPILSLFFCPPKITQPRPQVFSVNGSITCMQRAALLTSLVQYDRVLSKFVQQQLDMMNYACSFSQSETGKCIK